MLKPWAMERAEVANIHFREAGTAAYIWEDFVSDSPGKDRVQRGLDQAREKLVTMRANQELAKIMPGAPPSENVPAWAIGEYRAN